MELRDLRLLPVELELKICQYHHQLLMSKLKKEILPYIATNNVFSTWSRRFDCKTDGVFSNMRLTDWYLYPQDLYLHGCWEIASHEDTWRMLEEAMRIVYFLMRLVEQYEAEQIEAERVYHEAPEAEEVEENDE